MTTFIGIIISISLAYIAYQNYLIVKASFFIQKDKLRLDLFDKRYRIFRALQDLLSVFIPTGTFTRKDLNKFTNDSSDAEFLFGKDIKIYVDEINQKVLKLIHLNERLANPVLETEKKNSAIKEIAELESWFMNQLTDSKNLFKKYLHFSIDKNP